MRIMSPPPPLPAHGFRHFALPPEWPQPLFQLLGRPGTPTLHRLSVEQRQELLRMLSPQRAAYILGLDFGFLGRAEQAPQRPPVEEYDVRMTHASAKPRIGYTYDFAQDEEDAGAEGAMENKPAVPHVRTRTTIEIHDSPPLAPVDRKGKGRARTVDLDPDVIDISEDPVPHMEPSTMSPGSSSSKTKLKKRNREGAKREVVEILSDDESDDASGSAADMASPSHSVHQEKMQTVLVCASCRRPLRTGGDRLWALRCGHMIDSRCYRKIAERPIPREDIPVLGER